MKTTAVFLVLAGAVFAQDLTHKAAPQQRTIAIGSATVHPVSGPAIENGVVVFKKGRIIWIGKATDAKVVFDGEALLIDAKGKHVYPGFISPYSQLGLSEIGAVRASRDFTEVGEFTPEVRAAVAVNPDSTLLPVTRANGVLLFATFPRGGLLPGRASVMRMDGWTWEDMAVRADAGLVVRWPGQARRRRRRQDPERDAPGRAEKAMLRLGEVFGRARAYHRAKEGGQALRTDIRFDAMGPALRGERPVFFLANSYDQIVGAVHFAARHRLEAVIVGGRDAILCADLLEKHSVGVIVTGLHRFPVRSDSDFDEAYKLPAALEAAGIAWCLASSERIANERNLPYTAARAVAYGLKRDAALRALTLASARLLGVDKDYGSLEAGKSATLFICDGDPLEVTTNVERAFIDGREIDLTSKQTKLAEKYREKYRQLSQR